MHFDIPRILETALTAADGHRRGVCCFRFRMRLNGIDRSMQISEPVMSFCNTPFGEDTPALPDLEVVLEVLPERQILAE